MSLEITGRIINILPVQTGSSQRGGWQKQDFIIETQEQFPKKVCLAVWGDKVNELSKFKSGDLLKASINIESREYNGRWYTDVKAWRLDAPQQPGAEGQAPFDIPMPNENDMPSFDSNSEDNLPF